MKSNKVKYVIRPLKTIGKTHRLKMMLQVYQVLNEARTIYCIKSRVSRVQNTKIGLQHRKIQNSIITFNGKKIIRLHYVQGDLGHPFNTAAHSAGLILDPRSTEIIRRFPYKEN